MVTATVIFVLVIGGLLVWFLFRSGLICAPKHTDIESRAKPAERKRRREKKTSFATEVRKSESKHSPHPTMGGVFPPPPFPAAEKAGRKRDSRDLRREGLKPSRRPNLQPVMEAPASPNLVVPRVTRTAPLAPPPLRPPQRPPLIPSSTRIQPAPVLTANPCAPIRIERHPYAQTRGGYGSP